MMITDFTPHLIVPGRIAALVVACILLDGVLFRSKSSPFRHLVHKIQDASSGGRGGGTRNYHDDAQQNSPLRDVPLSLPLLRRLYSMRRTSAPETTTTVTAGVKAIPVSISMEALCIDTQHYFAQQLMPTWQILGGDAGVMDLSLNVFGNARILFNQTSSIVCQHGEAECSANSYMQCALDRFPSISRSLPFVGCLMKELPMGYEDEPYAASYFANCALHSALDWPTIQSCHDDPDEAWKLQYQAYQKTPRKLDHVPWVEVAGQYVSEKSSLLQAVCDAHTQQGGQHPACITPSSTVLSQNSVWWY